ncbi:zinc finger BED domain-containing protein 4-like [Ornithodoros turicata]|uniref:zinc finger BED domain-containing protein 4-like n=1 Tax=Ornithodoros turicata TaxID=34597 RepID=UPI003138EA51
MFSRMLYLREAVLSTIAILGTDLQPLTPIEWTILDKACHLLKPFKVLTEEMSSEKNVTLSNVILLSCALTRHVENIQNEEDLRETCILMADSIMGQLKRRFTNIENNNVLAEGTVLDRRFKEHGFSKATPYQATYRSICNRLSTVYVPQCDNEQQQEIAVESEADEPTALLWESFDLRVSRLRTRNWTAASVVELDRYLKEPLLPRKLDPMTWWSERKSLYPRLYELTKSRLCIPATSVPCERIFSKAGQIVTERRNRLSSKNVQRLLFLNANM